jgi:hypothetical protein
MWFVQLLDDLGKAFGLPNGTRDMNVENYGKLILQESDTTVGISIRSDSANTTAART